MICKTTQYTQGELKTNTAPLQSEKAAMENGGEEEAASGSVTLCVPCDNMFSRCELVFGVFGIFDVIMRACRWQYPL